MSALQDLSTIRMIDLWSKEPEPRKETRLGLIDLNPRVYSHYFGALAIIIIKLRGDRAWSSVCF